MEMSIIRKIITFVLGYRYYANIINTRGTDKVEICSFIFSTKKEANAHRDEIKQLRSFLFIETITFRSRRVYPSPQRLNK